MITSAEQITPQWLTKRLRQNGFLPHGSVTEVEICETFESTAAFLTPLKVTYSSESQAGPHAHLILKSYRDAWFGGGVIEAIFFNEIVKQMPNPPIFRCYDSDSDYDTRQCYFLFEDASVTHTNDAPEDEAFTVDLYKQIVDELLKFHAQWWEHPRISQGHFMRAHGGPLRMVQAATLEVTQAHCRHWREDLLPQFADIFGDEFSQEMHDFSSCVIESWQRLYIERIKDGKKLTLLHGDLHRWNIFYPKNSDTHSLYFLDWETYKRGIGTYDLCYLLGTETPARRREIEQDLLRYYYDGLVEGGVLGYSWEDCLLDYRLSVIANLFPAFGWQRLSTFADRRGQFQDWDCEELLA